MLTIFFAFFMSKFNHDDERSCKIKYVLYNVSNFYSIYKNIPHFFFKYFKNSSVGRNCLRVGQ